MDSPESQTGKKSTDKALEEFESKPAHEREKMKKQKELERSTGKEAKKVDEKIPKGKDSV